MPGFRVMHEAVENRRSCRGRALLCCVSTRVGFTVCHFSCSTSSPHYMTMVSRSDSSGGRRKRLMLYFSEVTLNGITSPSVV